MLSTLVIVSTLILSTCQAGKSSKAGIMWEIQDDSVTFTVPNNLPPTFNWWILINGYQYPVTLTSSNTIILASIIATRPLPV